MEFLMSGGRLVLPLAEPTLTAQGAPSSGATLTIYETGTTTLAELYADSNLTVSIANPQTSNSAGRFYDQTTVIWADQSIAYDCVLTLPDGEMFSYQTIYLIGPPTSTSGFAPINSPAFTGVPTAPTPAANDASSKIATTQFVATAIANASITPAGTVAMFAMSSLPAGWLSLCTQSPQAVGQAVSRTTYASLFGAIGTTYGAGDGSTTFNLPNMSGLFPRGLDPTSSVGVALGATQDDAMQGHYHLPLGTSQGSQYGISTWDTSVANNHGAPTGTGSAVAASTGSPTTDTVNGTPRVAAETRPINGPLVFAIKF